MGNKFPSRNLMVALHDTIMAGLSFVLAVYLRLGSVQMHLSKPYLLDGALLFTGICAVIFSLMRVYRGSWRYTSMRDIDVIVRAISLAVLLFFAVMFIINRAHEMPRSVPFINWMVLLLLLTGPRFLFRALHEHTFTSEKHQPELTRIPVLLVGVNDNAERFIRDMARDSRAPYEVIAIVDNDRKQRHYTLHRIPVYAGTDLLERVVKKMERKGKRPQKVVLTEDQYASNDIRQLLEKVDTLGIPLARLPRASEFHQSLEKRREIQPVVVEDLLGRSQNVLDRSAMRALITGKRILVTGAGGTIGGELTRQIASYNPAEMVLLERNEFNLYKIDHEIRNNFPGMNLRVVLADVGDALYIDHIFAQHRPEIVFHAAAIKHVPLAEDNVEETVLTNVFGTRTMAEACRKHAASVMVMISTDKAVNPTNVMGASKRLAECFCQALGAERDTARTRYITVRFGNVLGSTGSVVPLFQEQIAAGGPVTVTHPDMTRYFMTVREAVELVVQAASMGTELEGRRECVFVLDMGKPMKILDLAHQMIRLAGLRPGEDIQIVFTGLRQGEKLYEELFYLSENATKTNHNSIFLASPTAMELSALNAALELLQTAAFERDSTKVRKLLQQLVPEYQPSRPVQHDHKTRPDIRIVKNQSH